MECQKIEEIMKAVGDDEELRYEVFTNCMNSSRPNLVVSALSSYLNAHCITNSGIAEIAKKTPQAVVSMIKSNEADFPKPYNIYGTNYYISEDVVNWLIDNNKIVRNESDEIKKEYLYGTEKTVVFTGGPGNGKSTISVSAACNSIVKPLKRILTAGGSADTENLIKLHYKKNCINYVVFHYGESCNDSIPIPITENNVKRIKEELKKCKLRAKELREKGKVDELQGTYVEFVLQPNDKISKLMSDCRIDILTFVDTPGLDNKHSGESVSIADIIVVVLGDRDDIESISEKIKENIVPKTGTCQYVYLYNNRYALNVNEADNWDLDYEEYLNYAKEDLADYSSGLENLKDELVIGTTLSACKPFESLICVPNFSMEPGEVDDFFFSKFCIKLKEAFNNSLYFTELNNFDVETLGGKFLYLMNKHLNGMINELNKEQKYGFAEFVNEKHGRTKSLDNYRIEHFFNMSMGDLKNYFYNKFSKYKTDSENEDSAAVIRMVYLTINEGLMNRVHYGQGAHPWEDVNSPTQMICEEVLSMKIANSKGKDYYIAVLSSNGITSNSWNYVYVTNTAWCRAKLIISNKYKLPDFKAANLIDYIKVCHFLPSILVQSVLAYQKINPSYWEQNSYDEVLDEIMEGIHL